MTVARSTYISATLAAVGWDSWPPEAEPRYPAFEWDAPWLVGVDRVLLSSEPYRFRDRHLDEVVAGAGRPACLVDGGVACWYGRRGAGRLGGRLAAGATGRLFALFIAYVQVDIFGHVQPAMETFFFIIMLVFSLLFYNKNHNYIMFRFSLSYSTILPGSPQLTFSLYKPHTRG